MPEGTRKDLFRLSIVFFASMTIGLIILLIIPHSVETYIDNYVLGLIRNYKNREYSFKSGFRTVLELRIKLFLGILFIVLSFKEKSVHIILGYFGLCYGMVSGEIYRFMGMNGILTCFFVIFPHFVFYILAIIGNFLLVKILRTSGTKRQIRLFSMSLMIVILVLVGCVTENYVNLKILPKIN